jgi:hypothetical protein
VAQLHRISSRLTIRDIHDEVAERGHVHSTRVLLVAQELASALLAQSLGLRTRAKVFHTVLVHLENGVPIQYEDRYVNPAAAPDYLSLDFTQTTPAHHLLTVAPLTDASYNIEACLPNAQEAKALPAPPLAWPSPGAPSVARMWPAWRAWSTLVRATVLLGSFKHELAIHTPVHHRARAVEERRWPHPGAACLAHACPLAGALVGRAGRLQRIFFAL